MIYCNNIMINLSYTIIAGDITLSALTASRKQYQNKPQPSVTFPIFLPKYYCIHSFWSQNTEKRNNTISQMRLRSVFKMRASILNTATTEQMGYGIISFFVYFSPNESNSYFFYFGVIVPMLCFPFHYIYFILYRIFSFYKWFFSDDICFYFCFF